VSRGSRLIGEDAPLVDVTLPHGLRVVVDAMPGRATLSAQLRWPLGTVGDPDDALGTAVVLHEWLQRGAGGLDARAQADAFDRYGAQRGGGVGREHASLGFACQARDAAAVLPLLAASLWAPRLDEAEFEGARQLALQELAALADAPAERLSEAAVAARYAGAHGRGAYGRRSHLGRLRPDAVRRQATERLVPDGAVLALAGGGEAEALVDLAARAFGEWRGRAVPAPAPTVRRPRRRHLAGDGAQTQIAILDAAVPPGGRGWTEQALAMAALAGTSASRLWTEVRERRGLAYEVASGVRTQAGDAYRFTYAATTPSRAAETVDVLRRELERWREGIAEDELRRARTWLRANLLLDGEATGARVARLASDVVRFGRPRPLAEVLAALEAPTVDDVNRFLAGRPPLAAAVLTMGPAVGGGGTRA